uniref:Uncharacterized protein n=1 Tax=Timema douglasi TaxID=61478 RepID=A0A7R8Z6U4_TIMDO|nr:unnamed protein product [Timema douglasi]
MLPPNLIPIVSTFLVSPTSNVHVSSANINIAPSYHIQHQVFPAKWSYGVKDSSKHYANFSVIPNYQPLHAKSNGHFPPSKVREADKLATSRTPYDNNMNNMTPMSNMNGTATRKERNGFLLDDNRRVAGVTHEPGPKMGFDLQNVVSMEILESDVAYVEAKNEEVMRRVAEMQELVHSSEQYLTQQQQQLQQQLIRDREREREESDSESSHISSQDSDTPGQLKHSDSLLLLTQGQKLLTDAVNEAVSNIDLGETEPSESDTDSMSTPTNSPSHRSCLGKENESYSSNAALKASDSSFGLHSPDNLLPVGFRPNDHNIQDLLKRLQEDSTLPYNFAEGTLYLDPDIIDLTMIPPPITPDEDGVYALPPQLSLPPTPFADHFPLQTSLQTDYAGSHGSNEQDSLIDNFLDLNLDLEAFLATVTVPPPSHQAAPSVELTPEEIMSFIIPPPPANGEDTALSLTNGSSKKNTHEILGYKYNPQELSGTKVIEYPTVNRRGGPFSCCGKYKDSPEKSSSVKTISGTSVVDVPPILPPRSDASPPHGHLPRKPPLPPGPSQEILKKAQRSPIPVQKISNPVPVENGVHSTGKHSLPRNGYVTSRFINNREVLFSKSDATMVDLLQRLDQVVTQCSQAQAAGGGSRMDEGSFQVAKASLTEEARQLVTASKLLVKSATSPAGLDLPENLANCLHRLRRLTDLAADLTSYTTSPLQTRNLVVKVRDVASVFRETLVSALNAGTQESLLLARAENLASVLATLLRSLRVFSP